MGGMVLTTRDLRLRDHEFGWPMARQDFRRSLVVGATVASLVVMLILPAGAAGSVARAHGDVAAAARGHMPVPPPRRAVTVSSHRDPFVPGRTPAAVGAAVPVGSWIPLGPAAEGPSFLSGGGFYGGVNSGRITGLVSIPSGSHLNRVVAGTAGGGIWTSDDSGTTWTARSDQAPTLSVGSVSVDPSNPDHLIAGTGEGNQSGDSYPGSGILSSTDGGGTWAVQNPGRVFTGLHIAQVAIDPANSAHMFAATDAGLFVTTNNGVSWGKPTSSSYAAVDGHLTAVVIDPSSPATLYLGGGAATIARSTDGGVNWQRATGLAPPGGVPFVALAVAPSNTAVVYASVGSIDSPAVLYKTTNGGGTWAQLPGVPDFTGQVYSYGGGAGEQGWYDNVLAVDPVNAKHVIAGGIAMVETLDGGASWTNINGQTFFGGGTNLIHPDHHALAFRPDGRSGPATTAGLSVQPDLPFGDQRNGNLNITQFYPGSPKPAALTRRSQDNGSARTNKLAGPAVDRHLGPGTAAPAPSHPTRRSCSSSKPSKPLPDCRRVHLRPHRHHPTAVEVRSPHR